MSYSIIIPWKEIQMQFYHLFHVFDWIPDGYHPLGANPILKTRIKIQKKISKIIHFL